MWHGYFSYQEVESISSPSEPGCSCDFLWPTECITSDIMGLSRLGFKKPCSFYLLPWDAMQGGLFGLMLDERPLRDKLRCPNSGPALATRYESASILDHSIPSCLQMTAFIGGPQVTVAELHCRAHPKLQKHEHISSYCFRPLFFNNNFIEM